MTEVAVIYPHQLFKQLPAPFKRMRLYLVEEPLILTYNPIHRGKLMFHKLTMDAYQGMLEQEGYLITRLTISKHPRSSDIFDALKDFGVEKVHIIDTVDNYLEREIRNCGIDRVWYETPLFLLSKDDAKNRFVDSRKLMAAFYRNMRRDKDILIEGTGKPVGGQWTS